MKIINIKTHAPLSPFETKSTFKKKNKQMIKKMNKKRFFK